MARALILFAIILGIVVGGLMLLRRTARTGAPTRGDRKRIEIKPPDDDDDRGW
jgi:hypothetical protein